MLDAIFSPDNALNRFLTRFWDLIVLNAIFVVCSLPIFTLGASLSALYDIVFQMIHKEDRYIVRSFFVSFRKNFKRGTLLWLPLAAVLLFLVSDLYIIYTKLGESFRWLQFPVWGLVVLWICIFLYVWPLTARFEETYGQSVKNALLIGIGKFPLTVMLSLWPALLIDLGYHNGEIGVLIFSLLLFFGFALTAYVYGIFINHTLEKMQA